MPSPEPPSPLATLPPWIGADPRTLRLLELVNKIAATPTTALIFGESGSGKDLLAQRIHFLGPWRHESLVKIDCSNLPADLIESELFGYEKGAFTGAHQAKPGRLEMAGNGTLVLDEIAALSLPLQAKLLRVIEEKSFVRLGGRNPIRIQARLLALTNVDLERAVARHAFRADLYYRLFVLPVAIPPLRERPGDILPLTDYFLQTLNLAPEPPSRYRPALPADARAALLAYAFPGNVRELRNLVQRALIWGDPNQLTLADFPLAAAAPARDKTLAEMERDHIAATLLRHRGKKQRAADALGISAKNLWEKRVKYNLDPPKPRSPRPPKPAPPEF